MLVLTRKIGQQILIDKGTIQLKVLKIQNNSISLGFSAPEDIDIDRAEIFRKKKAKKIRAIAAVI